MAGSAGNTTAAATIGPAQAPRPTSSTPATHNSPHAQCSPSRASVGTSSASCPARLAISEQTSAPPALASRPLLHRCRLAARRRRDGHALLRAGLGRRGRSGCRTACCRLSRGQQLLDAGGLALALAQVVQLGAAHLAATHYFEAVDTRRVQQERALHADRATGDAAHRDARGILSAAQ